MRNCIPSSSRSKDWPRMPGIRIHRSPALLRFVRRQGSCSGDRKENELICKSFAAQVIACTSGPVVSGAPDPESVTAHRGGAHQIQAAGAPPCAGGTKTARGVILV